MKNVILIGGEKGGPGKSCTAQNTAICLQMQGFSVTIIDADPQLTTYGWKIERTKNENASYINCIGAGGNIQETIIAERKHCDYIVIDSGGGDSAAMRSAMELASHILFIFRPKRRDLATLPKIHSFIRDALNINPTVKINALIAQAPPAPNQNYRIEDAKLACESFGIPPLKAITMQRNIYDDAEENGLSVVDYENAKIDPKAAKEMHAIVGEFLGIQITPALKEVK